MTYYATIGEYGLGDLTAPPTEQTVFFLDADDKTIQPIKALVSHTDTYIHETVDVGEADIVVSDYNDVVHLVEDGGWTLLEEEGDE